MNVPTTEDFTLTLSDGYPVLVRHFEFDGGSKIDFMIKLDKGYDVTLSDIHKQSVRKAISLLQSLLPNE